MKSILSLILERLEKMSDDEIVEATSYKSEVMQIGSSNKIKEVERRSCFMRIICEACYGSGKIEHPDLRSEKCKKCDGKGYTENKPTKVTKNLYNIAFCPKCKGSVWQNRDESRFCFRCGQMITW